MKFGKVTLVSVCVHFLKLLDTQTQKWTQSLTTIDTNLTDSNVGARKNKNIRNHSFVINGIINDTVSRNKQSVDLAILDYRQCFDSLAVDVTTNDLYKVGVKNSNLNLINQWFFLRFTHQILLTPPP